MVACASCGFADNPAGARFCAGCGAALTEPTAAREERKVITCLFCDLVDFTHRSQEMDPEDVRGLLRGYHDRLRGELERFGGTVEKFIGDAVVAVFGAPAAHEDDPERAVRAALAIRDWARDEDAVRVRIAVNTGEALVTLGARPEQGESMVAGDVVNTASRLQTAAPVNGILVGETTYRATRDRIEYREADAVEAKGKTDRIPVWEAIEARSRVEVERPAGAPLVGRDDELAQLSDALGRVKSRREPHLVTLVGVPGIGKSRLVYELFRSVETGSELVYWRRGRSLPYGEAVSFWALGEVVKAQAGILESDAPEIAAQKLHATVDGLVDETEAAWVVGRLQPLVGLAAVRELSGDRQEEAFAAWRRFLEALAEQRPFVLVFEDLHWADDGLLDFVDYLVEWSEGVPLLVVCTARPELLERRPAWGGGKVNAATILLAPLSDTETSRLVHSLLGQSVLPAEIQTTLLARAGGNPLYAEEFVRLLGDERGDVAVPESVQGIIAARLDVLSPAEKELVQDAAVAGRSFWVGELAAIGNRGVRTVERTLHGLARREFVQRERRSSVAGDTQYTFRHALMREVAYGQIPRADRAEKHRRAAEWIESLGRPDDHAEMVAHHYLSALRYARAAGIEVPSLAEAAVRASRDAGERALALNASAAAIQFFGAALELLPDDDPSYPGVLFGLGAALHRSGDARADGHLERAAVALASADDGARAGEAHAMIAELAWSALNRERVEQELARALDLVRGAAPSASVARVLSEASRYRMLAGDDEEAIRLGREALAVAEQLGLEEVKAHALNNIGTARVNTGDVGGIDDVERSVEIALAANSPEAARAYNNLSVSLLEASADVERGQAVMAEAARVGERLGATRIARFARGVLGSYKYLLGQWDEYLQHAEAFLRERERFGPSYQELYVYLFRAEIAVARGQDGPARADARRGLALARDVRDPQALEPALTTVGRVEFELGHEGEARRFVREGLDSPATQRLAFRIVDLALLAGPLGLHGELGRYLAAAAPSPWREAARMVSEGAIAAAADALHDIGVPAIEAYARLSAARQLVGRGRQADADVQAQKALVFYRSVSATRYIEQAEALLAAAV